MMQYSIYNMQYKIWNMQYAIYNMQYEICNVQYSICNIQFAICCSHNVIFNKLYAIANGNMLYTIYNVQFVICNPSVSCVKYFGFWINSIHFYFRINKSECDEDYFSFKSFLFCFLWALYKHAIFANVKTNTANAWISHMKKGTL
jgi:hypothetical protein